MNHQDRVEYVRSVLGAKMTSVGADNIYNNDPQYAAQFNQLVQTMAVVDSYLEEVGLSQATREGVLDSVFTNISEHEEGALRLAKQEEQLREFLGKIYDRKGGTS